jgi:hypothetical protein
MKDAHYLVPVAVSWHSAELNLHWPNTTFALRGSIDLSVPAYVWFTFSRDHQLH